MKRFIIYFFVICTMFSCTKEQPNSQNDSKSDQSVSVSELETLKKEIEELKTQIETLMSLNDIEDLKNKMDSLSSNNDIENLKVKIEEVTSGYFEVDGLRFDKNGSIISTPKIENEIIEKKSSGTHTTTRVYDGNGRLIELDKSYSNYSLGGQGLPYIWKKEMYEYGEKTVVTTIQTYKWGLAAGTPYEEEITTTTYW